MWSFRWLKTKSSRTDRKNWALFILLGDMKSFIGLQCCLKDITTMAIRLRSRSEEHTSELQSPCNLVCRLLLEKKNIKLTHHGTHTSAPRPGDARTTPVAGLRPGGLIPRLLGVPATASGSPPLTSHVRTTHRRT